ncbi:YgcG family protein [Chitiniphilus purpureus]|uniref:YgcG family protein n=1 Tax=Chitiniphilus purpureus TaxID=2981137 RepID=A0ABY6DH63_9NEIS|nr:YgcG family protein [Chitiniphilus sp. CD1]UXY13687.1 YgcG family protein [Chitiniphilus sp. CD1]
MMRLAVIACLLLGLLPFARAEVPVPRLTARVTDLTGTLSTEQQAALDARLAGLERGHGSQLAILLVPSTQPETIEQYAIRVAEQWRLGRKGVDDGVLLLVAKNDRRVRIEVGYGLEGALTDATASRIIRETILPAFRHGDFAGGIQAGTERIALIIGGEALPAPQAEDTGGNDAFPPLIVLAAILFGGLILSKVAGNWIGSAGAAGVSTVAALGSGYGLVTAALVALGMLVLLAIVRSRLFWDLAGVALSHSGGGYRVGGGSGGGGGFSGGGGGFGGGGASGGW